MIPYNNIVHNIALLTNTQEEMLNDILLTILYIEIEE